MTIKRINLENFTVFDSLDLAFSDGINVFIGENGTGKTHLMKLLYAACQATRKDISFAHKIVKVFKPDDLNIGRLVKRRTGVQIAKINIHSSENGNKLSAEFNSHVKKWEAKIVGEEKWEKLSGDLVSTFIPAKEILSNARNLEAAVNKDNVDFDDTYIDVISSAKINVSSGQSSPVNIEHLKLLEKVISGKVAIKHEKFYMKSGSNANLEFHLVAEGMRKLALLWQLIKNGTLERGSLLFWDEPEANINPVHIPLIVEILLELQRNGVQIFISTHDYILAKYFEVRKKDDDEILFHSFFIGDRAVECESNINFRDLKENSITSAFNELLKEVFHGNWGD